jgi:hypothetical protein
MPYAFQRGGRQAGVWTVVEFAAAMASTRPGSTAAGSGRVDRGTRCFGESEGATRMNSSMANRRTRDPSSTGISPTCSAASSASGPMPSAGTAASTVGWPVSSAAATSSSLRVASGSPRTCCRKTCCNLVQPGAQVEPVGQRRTASQLLAGQGSRQVLEGQGFAAGFSDQAVSTSEVSSPTWACILQRETSRLICLILARKLISIICQPVLNAASPCYLIQML